MSIVKLVPVRHFEVLTEKGNSLGLFKVAGEWNGMRRLESINDKSVLIVDTAPVMDNSSLEAFNKIFERAFGNHDNAQATVLKGSPELLTKIGEP